MAGGADSQRGVFGQRAARPGDRGEVVGAQHREGVLVGAAGVRAAGGGEAIDGDGAEGDGDRAAGGVGGDCAGGLPWSAARCREGVVAGGADSQRGVLGQRAARPGDRGEAVGAQH